MKNQSRLSLPVWAALRNRKRGPRRPGKTDASGVALKRCRKCRKEKPSSLFTPTAQKYDGLFPWCNTCRAKYYRDRKKDPRIRHEINRYKREKYAIDMQNSEFRERRKRKERELRKLPGFKKASAERNRRYHLRTRERLAGRPKPEVCECCGSKGKSKTIHWDHDHKTGEFRGWICNGCNASLGHLKDSIDRIRKLEKYLLNPPGPTQCHRSTILQ